MANLLSGLGDAWADRVPVVAITGQVGSGKIGTMAKQYIDQQLLLQPLAGFTALLASADAADLVLPAALGSGRPALVELFTAAPVAPTAVRS